MILRFACPSSRNVESSWWTESSLDPPAPGTIILGERMDPETQVLIIVHQAFREHYAHVDINFLQCLSARALDREGHEEVQSLLKADPARAESQISLSSCPANRPSCILRAPGFPMCSGWADMSWNKPFVACFLLKYASSACPGNLHHQLENTLSGCRCGELGLQNLLSLPILLGMRGKLSPFSW